MRKLNQERGFTIVEMMFAVVVLLVGALGTLAMLDTANKRGRGAADRQNATAVARQVLEAAKGIPYRDVAPGSIVSTLREDAAIAGVSADPWRIERDNTTFTIEVDVCYLDEPRDGLGSRAPGNFCPGTSAGGTDDGNSIDHKRVTVVTSWNTDAGSGSSRAGDAGLCARRDRSTRRAVGAARQPVRLADHGPAHDDSVVQRHDGPGRSGGGLVARRRPAGDRVRVGEGLDLHLGAAGGGRRLRRLGAGLRRRSARAARCARQPSWSTGSHRPLSRTSRRRARTLSWKPPGRPVASAT